MGDDASCANKKSISATMSFISIVLYRLPHTNIMNNFASLKLRIVSRSLQKILENAEDSSYSVEIQIAPLSKLNAVFRTNHAYSLLLIEACSCDRRGERRAASRRASAPAATHGPIKRSLYPAMCTCPCKRAHVRHTLYPECSALFETIKTWFSASTIEGFLLGKTARLLL